jgi:hypothetical protein
MSDKRLAVIRTVCNVITTIASLAGLTLLIYINRGAL